MTHNRNYWRAWAISASLVVLVVTFSAPQRAEAIGGVGTSIQVVHDFTAAEAANQPGNKSELVEAPDGMLYGSVADGKTLYRLDPRPFQPQAFRTLDTGLSGGSAGLVVGLDGWLWGTVGGYLVRVAPGLNPASLSISSSLERAIAHAGSNPTTIRIQGNVRLARDLVVPANVSLEFLATGRLILAPGVDLSVLGNLTAAPEQWIFEAEADDSIVLAPQLATVYPQWWGARGDGATNDTRSLRLTAQFINRRHGGTISFLPGTYVVGRQNLAGRTGKGCAWCKEEIILLSHNTSPVVLLGNGAKLVAADGLRFGSFDPITGAPVNPPLPVLNADLRGDAYTMIDLVANADITVRGFELDGKIDALQLGGFWGDTGRQLYAYGVRAYNNERLHIEQVYTHHHGLDGIVLGWQGLTLADPPRPHRLIDVTSEYNARQGLSWAGGNDLHVTRGKFNYTGKARFSSSPGAGLDIEAESAVIRNGLFEDCEFIGNTKVGMVADSGDSANVTFRNSTFWGTTAPGGWAIWPNKPGFRFENCIVYGTVVRAFNATNPADGTVFSGCHFEDKAHPLYGSFVSKNGGLIETDSNYLLVENSTLVTHSSRGVFLDGNNSLETLRNVTITHGDANRADHDVQSVLRNVRLENVRFLEDFVDATDGKQWYVIADYGSCSNDLTVSGPLVRWQNHTSGAVGAVCPGITATESDGATALAEGGAGDSYSVVLNRAPASDVSISISFDPLQVSLNGDSDGTYTLAFTPANWSVAKVVAVLAVDDAVVEANPHTTVLRHAASSGDPVYRVINQAAVSVNIVENDAP